MQQHANPSARCCLLCKPPRPKSPLQHSRLQSPGVTIPMSQAPRLAQGALGSHVPAPPEPPPWSDAHDAERSVREQACWRRVMARKGDEHCPGAQSVTLPVTWTSPYATDTSLCHVPGVIPSSSELASKEEGGSYLGLKLSHPHGLCCALLAIRFPVQVRLHPGVFSTLVLFLASHSILATPLLHGHSAFASPRLPGKSQQPLETLRGLFSTKVLLQLLSVLQLSCSQPAFL